MFAMRSCLNGTASIEFNSLEECGQTMRPVARAVIGNSISKRAGTARTNNRNVRVASTAIARANASSVDGCFQSERSVPELVASTV